MTSCGCRKGATCPEHLAEADLTLPSRAPAKRPWWWIFAAPFYVVAGLISFLRRGSNA